MTVRDLVREDSESVRTPSTCSTTPNIFEHMPVSRTMFRVIEHVSSRLYRDHERTSLKTKQLYLSIYLYISLSVYIYIYTYTCIYIYIFAYINIIYMANFIDDRT